MNRIIAAAALIASLAIAAPASAATKTNHYSGKTDGGSPMAFSVKGKKLFNLSGYIKTTCVPTRGYPRTGSSEFAPPGKFVLGRTRKVSNTKTIPWWGDTKFNYTVSIKRLKGRTFQAKLHMNYSYVDYRILTGGYVSQTGYVCQGDDTFDFKVK